jgi:hypothetical protein
MNITFAPRGIIQIDDARIVYRNFSGVGSKYNREGDRNFSIVIPDEELAERLREEGWNVKIKQATEEGETPFMHLPVKVKFNDRGPTAYLRTGTVMNKLYEDTIGCLDDIDILSVDLDIRPYDWEVNGSAGRTAYLQSIHVTQQVDRFAERYIEQD